MASKIPKEAEKYVEDFGDQEEIDPNEVLSGLDSDDLFDGKE